MTQKTKQLKNRKKKKMMVLSGRPGLQEGKKT
jgi:hypothetical protein